MRLKFWISNFIKIIYFQFLLTGECKIIYLFYFSLFVYLQIKWISLFIILRSLGYPLPACSSEFNQLRKLNESSEFTMVVFSYWSIFTWRHWARILRKRASPKSGAVAETFYVENHSNMSRYLAVNVSQYWNYYWSIINNINDGKIH